MNIRNHKTPAAVPEAIVGGLPVWKLLAFTMAGFLAIMTETMPAGLLPQISQGLGVSEALAGQLVTLYALGSVLAAIPIIAATRSWNRRPLLLLAIGGLLIFNSVTALSAHYGLILVARFVAGMAAGVIWGLLAGYARRMVPHRQQGRALAVAGVGQPIALAIGVPLGTWLGTLFDWRGVFWIMSALSLLLFVWVRLAVPDFAGQSARQRVPIRRIFLMPGIRPILLALFVWILAHNILYTYIAPLLEPAGIQADIDRVLLVFGLTALLSIWLVGLLIDRWLRPLVLFSCMLFGLSALALAFWIDSPAIIYIAVAAWGLAFGGLPALLQTALAKSAGESADAAQSMLVTVWNLGIAGGGLAGGLLLQSWGVLAFPWAVVALMLLALCKRP